MVEVLAALEDDGACRIVLQDLCYRSAEVVMEWRPFPDTDMLSAFLIELVHLCLENHADALHQENAAKNRHHQLLVNDHGADADDASDSEASCVS